MIVPSRSRVYRVLAELAKRISRNVRAAPSAITDSRAPGSAGGQSKAQPWHVPDIPWLCSSSQTLENATYFTAHESFNANPGDVITAPEATVVVELQLETCLVENIFSSLDMLFKNWSKNEGLDMPGLAPKLVKTQKFILAIFSWKDSSRLQKAKSKTEKLQKWRCYVLKTQHYGFLLVLYHLKKRPLKQKL